MYLSHEKLYNAYNESFDISHFLDTLTYLDESDCPYTPNMVNIFYNNRLDKDLIKLEHFVEYANANSIDDAGYAISTVCEANNVALVNIGFVVDESSVLADDEIMEASKLLRENGFSVLVCPESDDSYFYQELNEALDMDAEYTFEESVNLLAYCEEFAPIETIKDFGGKVYDKAADIGSSIKKRVTKNYNNAKEFVTSSPKVLSRKLASIRKAISEKTSQLSRAAGDAKVFLKRQIDKLKKAYKVVKAKLVKAKDAVVDTAGKAKDKVVNTAKGAGKWVSDKVGKIRKTVFD